VGAEIGFEEAPSQILSTAAFTAAQLLLWPWGGGLLLLLRALLLWWLWLWLASTCTEPLEASACACVVAWYMSSRYSAACRWISSVKAQRTHQCTRQASLAEHVAQRVREGATIGLLHTLGKQLWLPTLIWAGSMPASSCYWYC
jgi:hypothetical protein